MLKTILLVCAAAVPPADCAPANALDVLRPVTLPGALCGIGGAGALAVLAGGALRPEAGRTYTKIICTR